MGLDHTPAELSDEQRANLTKLAAYLHTLPPEYPDFAMASFTADRSLYAKKPECGTAACAAGHGINAGIPAIGGETWYEYSKRAFAPDRGTASLSPWDWCFGASWAEVDNTAHGAADRINYMLTHGIPDDAWEQEIGHADLSYRAQVSA